MKLSDLPLHPPAVVEALHGRPAVTLADMPLHQPTLVEAVEDRHANDHISRRLRELGFVAGEEVKVVALGPFGREPLLVQVGFTRFALRRTEAARVKVTGEAA